ncbi:hypothetical protein B0H65DRAFT_421181, partial [Neurospora tetraspora]
LIDRINNYRETINASKPIITNINYNITVRVAIKRIYLEARSQLYIFYINKNIVLNIKRK